MPETLAPDISNLLAKELSIERRRGPIKEKLSLPRLERVPKELISIADNIAEISGTWNPVEIYTADDDSIATERTKFLESYDKGEIYNPEFKYSSAEKLDLTESRKKLDEQMSRLRNFSPPKKGRSERLMRAALYFKIKDDLATCDLVDGIKSKDEKKIAGALRKKYPGTDAAILSAATLVYNNLLDGRSKDVLPVKEKGYPLTTTEQEYIKELDVTDEQLAGMFRWALKEYGMLKSDKNPDGFDVRIDENATSIDVRDKSRFGPTVFIPKGRTRKADTCLELIAHEIEGHARQSVNGQKLFKIGGGKLKVDNEMLYEGLGKRYDDLFRKKFFATTSGEPAPYYTYAVAMAEQGGSFYEVFTDQIRLRLHQTLNVPLDQPLPRDIDPKKLETAKNNSWTTTYRVMRGHTDMKNPEKYAMAKDLSYLRGYIVDKQLQENSLGFMNEAGVIASGGLQLLAEFNLTDKKLPLPFKDVTSKYWETVLKPQMKKGKV